MRIVQKVPTAAGAAVGGVEKKRRAHARSYLSRAPQWGHGQELAPASRCLQPLGRVAEVGGTGCCGFTGPIPSATLDKIPTRLLSQILVDGTLQGNAWMQIFSRPPLLFPPGGQRMNRAAADLTCSAPAFHQVEVSPLTAPLRAREI